MDSFIVAIVLFFVVWAIVKGAKTASEQAQAKAKRRPPRLSHRPPRHPPTVGGLPIESEPHREPRAAQARQASSRLSEVGRRVIPARRRPDAGLVPPPPPRADRWLPETPVGAPPGASAPRSGAARPPAPPAEVPVPSRPPAPAPPPPPEEADAAEPLPAGELGPSALADVLRRLAELPRFGPERKALVEALSDREAAFDLTVEQVQRTGAFEGSEEHREGRTVSGRVGDADLVVAVRLPAAINERIDALEGGAVLSVRASFVDWDALYGRSRFEGRVVETS